MCFLETGTRGTTKIFVENEWENLSELSQRQRVRPSHACRINITVFACNTPACPRADGSEASSRAVLEVPSQSSQTEDRQPAADGSQPKTHQPENPENQEQMTRPHMPTMLPTSETSDAEVPPNAHNPKSLNKPATHMNNHNFIPNEMHEVKVPTHESFRCLPKED